MGKKLPIDFSKFALHSSDDKSATLVHPHGHKITIAKKALSPELQKQLESITEIKKMANGGLATQDQKNLERRQGIVREFGAQQKQNLSENSDPLDSDPRMDEDKALKQAHPKEYEAINSPKPQYQSGGQVAESDAGKNFAKVFGDTLLNGGKAPTPSPTPVQKAQGGMIPNYAEGTGDVQAIQELAQNRGTLDPTTLPQEEVAQELPPVEASAHPNSEQLAKSIQQLGEEPQAAAVQTAVPQMVSAPAAAQPQQAGMPEANLAPPSPLDSTPGMPNVMQGYQHQQEGYKQEAIATSAQAKATQQHAQAAAQALQKDLHDFHQEHQALTTERNAAYDALKNGSIKPDQYWDNHSKIASALGIIIAGFNPTTSPNAAIKMLEKQRDMDMQAQMANLNKQNNLLAANTAQFGNLRAGMDMTRIMQNDALSAQLKADAAKSGDVAANARRLQLAGALEEKSAMAFMPFVAQQALQKRYQQQDQMNQRGIASGKGQGQLLPEDPSIHVRMNPMHDDLKKESYKEIAARQEVKHNAPNILNLFDQAGKDQTMINTVGGFRDTGAATALKQAILPLFGPIDNTVRQAALDETLHNLVPKGGDTEEKLAYKRRAVISWLTSRAAAPVSKGNGIDLDRFQSTSFDPRTLYTPEENNKISILMHKHPQLRSVDEATKLLRATGKF